MAQTPENSPIEISSEEPSWGMTASVRVDHPAFNQTPEGTRDFLDRIIRDAVSTPFMALAIREDLEFTGHSVEEELFHFMNLLEGFQGRLRSLRDSAEAKRADERLATQRQNPPQEP